MVGKKIVRLDGEWECYWNQLLTPEDFEKGIYHHKTGYISIPGNWSKLKDTTVQTINYGCATFCLKIKLYSNSPHFWSLNIPTIRTTYKIWVNTKLVDAHGQVGMQKETSKADEPIRAMAVEFENSSQDFYLTIQLANFEDLWGGIKSSLLFGDPKAITSDYSINLFLNYFIFSSIVTLMIYHIVLFFFRKKDYTNLFFGIFCFLLSVCMFIGAEKGLLMYHFFSRLSWELIEKIHVSALYLGTAISLLYIYYQYPRIGNRRFTFINLYLGIVLAIFVFITPYRIFIHTLSVYQFIFLAVSVNITIVLVKAKLQKEDGSALLNIAFTSLGFVIVNDVLYFADIIHYPFLINIGLYIFMLINVPAITLKSFRLIVKLIIAEYMGKKILQ